MTDQRLIPTTVGYSSVNAIDGLKSCDFYMAKRLLAVRTDTAGFWLWQGDLGIALEQGFVLPPPRTAVRMTSNGLLGFKMKEERKAFPPPYWPL